MKVVVKIALFLTLFLGLFSCAPTEAQRTISARADSLLISVRCVRTVSSLIADNFLVPGQKKAQYRMEYIHETWPDTITKAQAAKLVSLADLRVGFERLIEVSKSLQSQSAQQLEQLKKLNNEINSGASSHEDLLQYLTFESKCADTLNRVLDTLVKRSIALSCKGQSL